MSHGTPKPRGHEPAPRSPPRGVVGRLVERVKTHVREWPRRYVAMRVDAVENRD